MKIGIVGTGAMGCVYAALLADAGNEVWAVDSWAEHVAAMAADGLYLEGASGTRTVRLNATTEPAEAGPCDLVIIATKAMDVAAAAEAADRQIALEQQESARARRRYIAAAVRSKRSSVVATRELYRAGRVSLSDLLVQEMDLLQLQIQERGAAYAEMTAILRYHAVAGRLTAQSVSEIVRRKI